MEADRKLFGVRAEHEALNSHGGERLYDQIASEVQAGGGCRACQNGSRQFLTVEQRLRNERWCPRQCFRLTAAVIAWADRARFTLECNGKLMQQGPPAAYIGGFASGSHVELIETE